jgi:hypothetical protein
LQVVDQAAVETAVGSTQLAIPVAAATAEQTAGQVAVLVVWLKYLITQLSQAVKLDCTLEWAAVKCLKITYNRLANKVSRVNLVI